MTRQSNQHYCRCISCTATLIFNEAFEEKPMIPIPPGPITYNDASDTLSGTIKTRDKEYGGFERVAEITQKFKGIMKSSPSYVKMTDVEKEAMEMVMHKCARLLAGNPHHLDSWHDIQGYAKLVEDRLPGLTTNAQAQQQGLYSAPPFAMGSAPRADGFATDGT